MGRRGVGGQGREMGGSEREGVLCCAVAYSLD